MIRINLLPAELEAAPTRINPAIPLSAAVFLPALLLVPIHLNQVATRKRLQTESASLKSDLERYQPIIAQVDALEAAKVQLTQKKSVIQQLESERLRYPQFLEDFVKLLPGNLWLTNLATTEQAGNNTMMGINMDVVALDNYAIADLIANLETSQIFSEVELGTISASQSPTGQTMTFHVSTNYKKAATLTDASKKS
jgi:type IV pilus assembly protein PilN